jgi:hypothetical protein
MKHPIRTAAAAACLLAWHLQAQTIRIRGTVVDDRTGKPIAGAVARLARAGLADTTGADGVFDIRGAGSALRPAARTAPGVNGLALDGEAFRIDAARTRRAELSIHAASGARVHRQSRVLFAGRNFAPLPRLADGTYLLALRTEAGLSTLRFECLRGRAWAMPERAGAGPLADPLAKGSAAFADTLILAAAGYATIRTPLTAPIDSGLGLKATADGPGPDCGQSPADPLADSKARNLLCYLRTHAYVSGQTDLGDADKVKSMTGRYPAIVAFDFMGYTSGQIQTQAVIDWARSKKGIVAFQWHWNCPYGGNYAANCDFEPDLGNAGSKLYKDIDLVMRELRKMGDAGVPVLFRPLHEANNNYMWWAKRKQDAFKKLWMLLYQRAQLAGAHNIVWVFNGMASGQGTSLASWYPGDRYVDLVTSDYFQGAGDYSICKAVGAAKTVAIAETFNELDPAKDSPWSYSVVWASRDWGGKNAEQSWKTAMANPRTISIDQLPDMSKW